MNEQDKLKATIKPEDIVMDNSEVDDADMPRPEVKQYKKYLKVTPKFLQLFYRAVDSVPYRTILQSGDNTIALSKLVKFVEGKREKMSVNEMDIVISYMADLNFGAARAFMEAIEAKETQQQLWSIFEE